MTTQSIFGSFDDPDNIAQSEYRVVHEHLGNLIASFEPDVTDDEKVQIVIASLDELVGFARAAEHTFRLSMAASELAADVERLRYEIETLAGSHRTSRGVKQEAVTLYSKLQRAKEDIDQLPEGDEKTSTREVLHEAVQMLMVDIFGLDPATTEEATQKEKGA